MNPCQQIPDRQHGGHFCATLQRMNTEKMVAELFDIFDVNNDGVISRGEFVSLAEALLQEKGLNFSSDIFKKFDANHDNVISREEMIDLVLELAL
jgi:Ca2+-binding EF-hand superfamily protein